jgi:hypothetical protein
MGTKMMDELLKINFKYTIEDIKSYFFSKMFSRLSIKLSMIIFVFIFLLIFFATVIEINNNKAFQPTFFMETLIGIIIFSCVWIIIYMFFRSALIKNFHQSNTQKHIQSYIFMNEKITITSETGNFSIMWEEVYKIQELKPCFLIFTSPVKYFIIPRRCFIDSKQLALFYEIISSKLKKKKLKLKHYKLGKVSPDLIEGSVPSAVQQTNIISKDKQLFELHFSLTSKDVISMNIMQYYTKPAGILITILGTVAIIYSLIIDNFKEPLKLMILIFGISIVFISPIKLILTFYKNYNKDAQLKKPYNFRFYKNSYVIEHESGINRVSWSDLVKIDELKSAFLLYTTKQIAHIIPKRAFAQEDNKEKLFRELIGDKLKKHGKKS